MKKPLLLFLSVSSFVTLQAQSGTVSAGGDASSSAGSVSYSIGQVDFRNITSSENSLNQGLQQPFEFFVISVEETFIEMELNLFPNPTRESVMLKIQSQDFDGLQYQLFDEGGKLLDTQKITGQETKIDMASYAMASYFLRVTKQNSDIKTFQIIKNF
jgi:hypothetical protein